ncbi:MAG: beta galactosidase jelly roll domain-containing protein [Candidatus Omnitrophica bacterium]|nr:beta galactosidase jelly roll domain-containing protein [Candidatus Omnitrophota bacterium]
MSHSLLLSVFCLAVLATESFGIDYLLDGEWKFQPVQVADFTVGEDERAKTNSAKDLADSEWESIQVPGYWDQPAGGWPWSSPRNKGGPHPKHDGEAWYRHRFTVPENRFPEEASGKGFHATLRFESVSAQASVWLNGIFVGRHLGAFGPFEVNVTDALLRNQPNVLSIRVRDKTAFYSSKTDAPPASSSRIPLGFDSNVGGIRGSVSVHIGPKARILDLAASTDSESATVEVAVSSEAIGNSSLVLELTEKSTGKRIEVGEGKPIGAVTVKSGVHRVRLRDFPPDSPPKSWSPESPNLYRLTAKLMGVSGSLDVAETDIGFRSFHAGDGQFLLNDRPYFLLGAGSPPHYDLPGEEVMRSHLSQLKEAGVRAVRFAYEPPTERWLSLCDEIGLLAWVEGPLSVEEGTYDFANADLVRTASAEMKELARRYKNHPSLGVWTIGSGNLRNLSEKKSRGEASKALRAIAAEMRKIDRDAIVLPESDSRGFIDSPVEDWSSSLGWYRGKDSDWGPFLKVTATRITGATSPWVCSALETGYSSAGQGRVIPDPYEEAATRMRIGRSGEDRNRLLFAQSNRVRRLVEVARARRDSSKNRIAGIFPFTSANWFFYPLTPGEIRPKPILASLKEAYKPIILSLELPQKNFYAGELLETTVTVVNDSPDLRTIKGGNLILEAIVGADELNSQTQRENLEAPPNSSVPYSMVVVLPEDIQGLRHGTIRVRLSQSGGELASNEAEIQIAPRGWSRPKSEKPFDRVLVYDPKSSLTPYFEEYSLRPRKLENLDQLIEAAGLIVGSGGFDDYLSRAWPTLERWLDSGGRMAVLDHSLRTSRWTFSGPYPPGYEITPPPGWPTGVDRVNVTMEGHPLFEGIRSEALDDWGRNHVVARNLLTWVGGENPPYGHHPLVDVAVESGELDWGEVVVEDRYSEGSILYSQLELTPNALTDPVACKILSNLIDWAGDSLAPVFVDIDQSAPGFLAPLVGNSQNEVVADFGGTGENEPIRALVAADGPFEATSCCGKNSETKIGVRPLPNEFGSEKRVYYDIDDRFWFDKPGKAEVTVLVNSLTPAKIRLDYDSNDKTVEHLGHYRQSNVVEVLEVGIWKEVVFSAPQAQFGNRQKNGADFRLTTVTGDVIYGPISVKRIE